MDNKRGQGLSVNAIILILLGIAVLVVLILGFTMGWARVLPFIQTNNVDNIKTACDVACATQNKYDFCSQDRTLKVPGEDDITTTCINFATEPDYAKYGISDCSQISCDSQ